jgi:hypothetical protein
MNPPRMAVLACQVFEREIALLAAGAGHIVETTFFEVGLHDRPDQLRATLQAAIHQIEQRDDVEAIALAYGLCGKGAAGLQPARCRLVIPRAHDCITVFMGSKEAYAAHQQRCPTCYYYTPGWNRVRRVPGPDRLAFLKEDLARKFEADDVEFLLETEREQWALRDTATYLDLGTSDAEAEADYAQRCAQWLGWKFERLSGDPKLLRDLLWGDWDAERFQIVEPGTRLAHSPDDAIMRSETATPPLETAIP